MLHGWCPVSKSSWLYEPHTKQHFMLTLLADDLATSGINPTLELECTTQSNVLYSPGWTILCCSWKFWPLFQSSNHRSFTKGSQYSKLLKVTYLRMLPDFSWMKIPIHVLAGTDDCVGNIKITEETHEWVMFSEYKTEDTTSQNCWNAPELGDLVTARKERVVGGFYKSVWMYRQTLAG